MLNLKQSDKQQGLSFINFSEYLFSANNEIMATPDPKTEVNLLLPTDSSILTIHCRNTSSTALAE
jgi:hypothetical protein